MSALTKLFVVLLVVCSLLLCGAVVVFVNRVEDYQKAYKDLKPSMEALANDRDVARADAIQQKTSADKLALQVDSLTNNERNLNDSLATERATRLADKTDATKQVDAANKRTEIAQSQAAAAEKRAAAVEATVAGLLKQNNDQQAALANYVATNADLVRQNEIQARDIRSLNEQLQQKTMELARALKIIGDNRLDLAQAKVATPDLLLIGVIRGVQKDPGGKYFATISLGISDRVTEGMQFFVLSPESKFLAKFVVDKVDDRESFGHLEGPTPDLVQKECEVRTKL